jgi:bacterioferritin
MDPKRDGKHEPAFLHDLRAIRERARRAVGEGAVTAGYQADRGVVVDLLNAALATEIVCVLRYKRHEFTVKGIHAESVAAEFRAHAEEERVHADQLAKRIVQLGGSPDFSPEGVAERAASEYDASEGVVEMLREDLVAERIAIETYTDMIRYVGDDDPTTTRLLEEILAKEEEHADDLVTLMAAVAPREPVP